MNLEGVRGVINQLELLPILSFDTIFAPSQVFTIYSHRPNQPRYSTVFTSS
jgi:hypothetical protein